MLQKLMSTLHVAAFIFCCEGILYYLLVDTLEPSTYSIIFDTIQRNRALNSIVSICFASLCDITIGSRRSHAVQFFLRHYHLGLGRRASLLPYPILVWSIHISMAHPSNELRNMLARFTDTTLQHWMQTLNNNRHPTFSSYRSKQDLFIVEMDQGSVGHRGCLAYWKAVTWTATLNRQTVTWKSV